MAIAPIASYEVPSPACWPASRAPWTLTGARAALLVHDMQEYFLSPFDRAASPARELVRNVRLLIALAHQAQVPVFFSVQPGEQTRAERGLLWDVWGPGIVERPELRALLSGLEPTAQDVVIEKRRYSAFHDTQLAAELARHARDQLVICGVYGHIGCLATATDAFMRGVQPFMAGDALGDFSREDHLIALRQTARTCGVVALTAELAATLAQEAVRRALSEVLENPLDAIEPDDELADHGLDSIRAMALIERLFGAEHALDFAALAEARTARAFAELLLSQHTES